MWVVMLKRIGSIACHRCHFFVKKTIENQVNTISFQNARCGAASVVACVQKTGNFSPYSCASFHHMRRITRLNDCESFSFKIHRIPSLPVHYP